MGEFDWVQELCMAVSELSFRIKTLEGIIGKMEQSKGETHTHIHYPPSATATPVDGGSANPGAGWGRSLYNPNYNPNNVPVPYQHRPATTFHESPVHHSPHFTIQDGALEKNPDAADSG